MAAYISRAEAKAIAKVSDVLVKMLPTETVADILEHLVGCDGAPELNDLEAEIGERMFSMLRTKAPGSVELCYTRMRGE